MSKQTIAWYAHARPRQLCKQPKIVETNPEQVCKMEFIYLATILSILLRIHITKLQVLFEFLNSAGPFLSNSNCEQN